MPGELDNVPAAQMYSMQIVKLWLDCLDLAQQARVLWLKNEFDNDINFEYIARLTRLWGELYPKIRGREDMKELVTNYEKFQSYYRDPSMLIDKPEDIIRLEEVIRDSLEKLKLTRFE